MRVHALGTGSLLLVVAADDALARRKRTRLADLADREFVEYRSDSSLRASIDEACVAAALHRRVSCEAHTIADLIGLVAHGLGVSLLPPAAVRMVSGGVVGLVSEPRIERKVGLVAPLDRRPSPAAAAMVAVAQAAVDQMRLVRRVTRLPGRIRKNSRRHAIRVCVGGGLRRRARMRVRAGLRPR